MCLFTSILVGSTLAISALAGPKLVCDQPLYDFGTRGNTQVVHHVFSLMNTGDAAVEISRVISSCGCVGAKPQQGRIEPGQSLSLDVWIDLKGRTGPQNKPVFAVWNNPLDARPLRLALLGAATAGVEAEPAYVSFGVVSTTGVVERVIRVFAPDTNQTVQVIGASCSDMRFTARIHVREPRHAFDVTVSAAEPRIPSTASAILTITTDHPDYSILNVPIYMRVHAEPEGLSPLQ